MFKSRHGQIDYVDVVNAGDIIFDVSFGIPWTFVLGCKLKIRVGASFQVDCASSLLLEFPNCTSQGIDDFTTSTPAGDERPLLVPAIVNNKHVLLIIDRRHRNRYTFVPLPTWLLFRGIHSLLLSHS